MGFPQPDTGSVTEDTGVVGGFLSTSGDVDFGPFFNGDAGQWTAQTISGAYGSQLVIDANGVWTYTANNSNATIQALDTGQSVTEVFTVSSTRGNTTITITINGQDEPPCFAEGTLIETEVGPKPIESLKPFDRVVTRDSGLKTLRWIGSAEVDLNGVAKTAAFAPVRIAKDALAPGLPDRDLLLSPQHRILLQGYEVQCNFGEDEVFCPVINLVNGTTIRQEGVERVTYFHLLFDTHEVVMSSGCASESFFPGHIGLGGIDDAQRDEMFTLFPELRAEPTRYGPTARRVLKGYETNIMRDALVSPFPFLKRSA